MSDLEVRITGNPSGAVDAFVKVKESARDFSKEIGQVSQDVTRSLLEVAGVTLSLKAGLDAVGGGFAKGDEIRDLEMSLGVFSGSAEKGRQAMGYFEDQMSSTRNTAHELAQTFRDEVPLAMGRGFSRESMQQITVWLSQFATVSHQSLATVESGFESLLSGVIKNPAKNSILSFLGVTKADVATLGWDQVINKIADVASHAEDFGQSFESTMHKVHDAWFVAFGEGVNGAMDGNREALNNLKDALTDPAFLGALHDLGGEFANLVIGMRDIVAGYRELKAEQNGSGGAGFDAAHPVLTGFANSWMGMGLDSAAAEARNRDWNLTQRTKDAEGAYRGFNLFGGTLFDPSRGPGNNTYGPPTPTTEQLLQSQLGVSTITGYGGDVHAFYARVASDLETHKGQAKEIIDSVKDEVHGSVLAWTDYSSSVQYAIKPTGELADETKKNAAALGLVKSNAEQTGAALLSAAKMYAEITLRRDSVQSSTKALGDYLDPAALALDAYSAAITKNAGEAAKELAGIAEAAKKLGDNSPEVKKLRDQIVGLNQDADSQALLKYMHDATAIFAKIDLTPADPFKQDFSLPTRSTSDVLARIGLQPDDLSDPTAKQFGTMVGHAHGEEVKRLLLDQQFVGQIGDDFARLIESGGRNFTGILSSGLSSSVHESAQKFAAMIFGAPGNASSYVAGTSVHQDPNHLYDASGHDITGRAQTGRAVMAGIDIAASGYQAGLSGQPGARTGATLGGAASGAAIGTEILPGWGTAIGAVVGAIVGAISGAVGASQRQSEYPYAKPYIMDDGTAYLNTQVNGGKNIQPAKVEQMTADLQSAYDSIRDALVKDILPYAKIAKPPAQYLDGTFQPEASGHFMEHWDQFIHDTLPRTELGLFKEDLKGVGVALGMSAEAFDAYAKKIDDLDPTKQAAIYGQLFAGEKDIQDANNFNHFGGWNGQTGKSDVWMGARLAIGEQNAKTPGQLMQETDQQIIDLGNSIASLSPEGQAAAFQQLGQMEMARIDLIKQGVQQLLDVATQFHQQTDSIHETVALGLMTKADGSVDYHAQAQYEKERADADLQALRTAKNAADAQKYGQQYLADIQKAEQFGMQDASNDPATQKAWLNWLDSAASIGTQLIDTIIGQLGGTFNDENDRFNALLDPAIQAFLDGIKKATPPPYVPPTTGDTGDGTGDKPKPTDPIIKAYDVFTTTTNALSDAMTAPVAPSRNLALEISALAAAVRAARSDIANGGGGQRGSGNVVYDPHPAFEQSVFNERYNS